MSELFGIVTGMASSVGNMATNIISGGFLSGITSVNTVFVLAILAMFIFVTKRTISTVITFAMVSVASAAFPVVLNYLGFSIPITMQTIVFFVIMGIATFIVFIIGRYIMKILGVFGKKEK